MIHCPGSATRDSAQRYGCTCTYSLHQVTETSIIDSHRQSNGSNDASVVEPSRVLAHDKLLAGGVQLWRITYDAGWGWFVSWLMISILHSCALAHL
jgi:hypothetical protein